MLTEIATFLTLFFAHIKTYSTVCVGTSGISGTKNDLIRDLDGMLEGDEKKAADGAISLHDEDTMDRLAAMRMAQATVGGSLFGDRRAGHAEEEPKRWFKSCWWCGGSGKKAAKPKQTSINKLSTWNHGDNEVSSEGVQRNSVLRNLYKIMAMQRRPHDAQAGIYRRGLPSWMYKSKNQYGWWF
ncbi:hypothetical protein MAR_010340, partial [Mya arenaria]